MSYCIVYNVPVYALWPQSFYAARILFQSL